MSPTLENKIVNTPCQYTKKLPTCLPSSTHPKLQSIQQDTLSITLDENKKFLGVNYGRQFATLIVFINHNYIKHGPNVKAT